jgi:hypothetical protein
MGSPINLIFGRSTPLGPGLQSWESADFPSVLSFLASPSKHSFQCSTKFSRQFIGNTLMAIDTVFLSMALQSGTWSGALCKLTMSCWRLSFQAPIFHALFTSNHTFSIWFHFLLHLKTEIVLLAHTLLGHWPRLVHYHNSLIQRQSV